MDAVTSTWAVIGKSIATATAGPIPGKTPTAVPELQRRGAYPTAYKPGTLREKLFGEGPLLPDNHPAARYRDIEAVKREQAAQATAEASDAPEAVPA